MKKLIFTFILLVAAQSCDDFVEIDPIGPVASNYFTEAEHYDKALIGAYDLLQSSFWNVQLATIASPDINAGGDAVNYDQPTLQDVDKMIHTQSTYVQIRDVWQNMYAGMNRANFLLEAKDKLDFDGKESILGQTYFLRAYFAFELAKFFGDIPLLVNTSTTPNRIQDKQIFFGDQFEVNRVGSISKVYDLIEEDLKEAISLLPNSQEDAWRITKMAAHALLGKVQLFNEKYIESATSLQVVIDSGDYALLTNGREFQQIWGPFGENSDESVFEIQYTSVEGAGWDCITCSEGTYMPKFNNPRSPYDNSTYASGWGFSLPTDLLYDAYKSGDARRNLTILDLRSDNTREKSREDIGFFTKKYLVTNTNDQNRTGPDPLNFDNNYRAIRYADVLLMASEAYANSNNASKATELLNLVRARAFGDNSQDYDSSEGSLLDAIIDERRLELAAEGHYFFDLIRTGKAKAAFDEYNNWIATTNPTWNDGVEDIDFAPIQFTKDKNELFPIPLVELELANAIERWGQNPGY